MLFDCRTRGTGRCTYWIVPSASEWSVHWLCSFGEVFGFSSISTFSRKIENIPRSDPSWVPPYFSSLFALTMSVKCTGHRSRSKVCGLRIFISKKKKKYFYIFSTTENRRMFGNSFSLESFSKLLLKINHFDHSTRNTNFNAFVLFQLVKSQSSLKFYFDHARESPRICSMLLHRLCNLRNIKKKKSMYS